jgi:putative membrane-bound dehydrogenase-like protein
VPRLLCAFVLTSAVLVLPARRAQQGPPPYPPDVALSTIRVVEGFQVELFASEPLVASPVAMEVDESGRTFVVEMHGYPLDVSGSGRIMLLADTDRDGKPDRSTVFAERLRLPTGIMKWKKGVLVTDSPQVWYLEDTDGDGRADVKQEVLTGFALTNPQHTTNTPVFGLDNWIYLANEGPVRTIRYKDIFGDAGGEVRFPGNPSAPRLPPDADGRNVRFRPDTYELEMLATRSQFGQTFDPWGHQFLVTNSRHIYHEVVTNRYLSRNPSLVVQSAIEHIPDYRLPATLFPITKDPQFQLLTDVGVMTAASGLTYYLGGLFPPAYRNAAFVAEGTHNLVHVASVRDHGTTFRASRMFEGREFLASTDSWFRPVNFYVGPDGALYLIDYYRKILEHPEWLDEATAKSADLYAGRERGRIYRIVPAGTPPPSWMDRVTLGDGSTRELLQALEHPNIWWRRHAQRLLMDRKPEDAASSLSQMIASAPSPMGRVHALWTLEGLGRMTSGTIERALQDGTPGVRENAIKVAELHLARNPALASALLSLENDPDPKVRFQLLLTLGNVAGAEASRVRTRLLFTDVEDEWVQIAALSASGLDELGLLRAAVERTAEKETPARRALLSRIGALAAAARDVDRTRAALRLATATAGSSDAWWRAAVLEGVAGGTPAERRKSPELEAERQHLARMLLATESAPVRRAALHLLEVLGLPAADASTPLLQAAERLASDRSADAAARADAVRLLALRDVTGYEQLLRAILSRPEPAPVQLAAVRALADPKGEAVAAVFVELWERWTPAVRDEAVRALVREPGRIRILLDAITAGRVRVSEIEWPLRVRMMMSDDDALRGRARDVFADAAKAGSKTVERYRAAATMDGDPARGRDIFSRACSTCHQYRGSGGQSFGPDLGEVRGRLPLALLTDILQPNHSIADGYELWLAELADGKAMSGVIAAETPTSVTFRQAGGTETTIARSQIGAMRIAPVSAMPEGLDTTIDVQQMADLIAFIKGGQ